MLAILRGDRAGFRIRTYIPGVGDNMAKSPAKSTSSKPAAAKSTASKPATAAKPKSAAKPAASAAKTSTAPKAAARPAATAPSAPATPSYARKEEKKGFFSRLVDTIFGSR